MGAKHHPISKIQSKNLKSVTTSSKLHVLFSFNFLSVFCISFFLFCGIVALHVQAGKIEDVNCLNGNKVKDQKMQFLLKSLKKYPSL